MSNPKPNSRRNKRRKSAKGAASSRPGRPEIAPLGARLVAGTKWLFAWDNKRSWRELRWQVVGGWLAILPVLAWAFWPTLIEILQAWNNEPDYSHGFLVPPIALFFLWARRQSFPGWSRGPLWAGLALIGAGVVLRALGAHFFLGAVDGWAMVICIAGVVWAICGTRVYWYCLPSITFLFLAVPLPYRVENGVSYQLQGIATKLSTWTLQLLGQPALAMGHTILLAERHLEVERACSGMRIFLGIFAIAFVYVVLVKLAWWEKALIALAIIPIALAANAIRIVSTGLLYQFVSGEAARGFSHDYAGYVMIPLAASMFALMLWYLKLVFREVDIIDAKQMITAAKK